MREIHIACDVMDTLRTAGICIIWRVGRFKGKIPGSCPAYARDMYNCICCRLKRSDWTGYVHEWITILILCEGITSHPSRKRPTTSQIVT